MNELTLEQKIEFCNWYLLLKEWKYICIGFKHFCVIAVKKTWEEMWMENTETTLQLLFPELHEMIITVGKEIKKDFKWGSAWTPEWQLRIHFRMHKIKELKTQLEKQR